MKQEPVAWGWMYEDGRIYDVICPEEHAKAEGEYTIPLYTAPRELSMEEIEDCMPDGATPDFVPHNKWFKEFANNILKKASEK